jgi:hypothetical protein
MCENNDSITSQSDIITKCDAIATSSLALHDQLSKVRAELSEIHTKVDELTSVISSSRDIDLTAAYSAHRPHTDKWFREDGTLRTNKYSRSSIPIRAYRARIPLTWVNTPTREVHIKIPDPEFQKLNLPVEDVINAVVGPDSAECDYLDDYTDLVYWYFQAPDCECDRLAVEIVSRLLAKVYPNQ